MKHIVFGEPNDSYKIAVLIKEASFKRDSLHKHYVGRLINNGLLDTDVIAFSLTYNDNNKAPASLIRQSLQTLLKACKSLHLKTLIVADSAYFKILTKERKADPHIGYVLPCKVEGYTDMNVMLVPNYSGLFYNPELIHKIDRAMDAVVDYINGVYTAPGIDIIHREYYPTTKQEIVSMVRELHTHSELTCDIETTGLIVTSKILTIAFAWNQHEGLAFEFDKPILKEFFSKYKGTLIFHNASFDTKLLIYNLYMDHPLDHNGLLIGLETFYRSIHDTKLITYLATNSASGNNLGLKENASEFAGNYAQEDIDMAITIPTDKLLRYNLVDCLSTWYVYNKYHGVMVKDSQLAIYNDLFIPSLKTIVHMELVGMPVKLKRVYEVAEELQAIELKYKKMLSDTPEIKELEWSLQIEAFTTKNLLLKKKVRPIEDFIVGFNPNSGVHVRKLLFEQLGFEPIDFTDTGLPAVGKEILDKLLHRANPVAIKVLTALIELNKVTKITNTFIPILIGSIAKDDGAHYIHGSFNLGGTKSGRLSSNSPNLTNLPSGSTYGKLIKSCFSPPDGWLFVGCDFSSLESTIDALLTNDPMKEAVYTDGFDSHCLASYFYFKEQMPDIEEELQGYFDEENT